MLKRIHHIDFLVRDMDQAIAQYTRIFGVQVENRVKVQGVELTYFHIGDVLIALISPIDSQSPLQKQLDEKGEGLMHMGCEVESLEVAVQAMKANGVRLVNEKPRSGLQDWQIKLIDLVEGQTNGPTIQLVERA
jgi:methylmalonyl-CoA/ethylmalonyl-CoA epimerase